MKLKIIILMILMIISINNVSGVTEYIDDTTNLYYEYTDSYASPMGSIQFSKFYVKNMENYNTGVQMIQFDLIPSQFISGKKASYDSYNEGIILKTSTSEYICDGIIGYYKLANNNYRVYIWFDIDNWINPSLTGAHELLLEGHNSGNYGFYQSQTANNINLPDKGIALGQPLYTNNPAILMNTLIKIDYIESWKTIYTYYTENNKNILEVQRDNIEGKFYTSKINANVINTDESLLHETSYHYYNTSMFTTDLINLSWYLNFTSTSGKYYNKTITFISDEILIPTLTTDKTYYNTSEQIIISYTNINKLYEDNKEKYLFEKPYEVYILYPVTNDYKQYEAKFRQYLYSDLRDETFTLNTSFLSPQNVYILGIVGKNGYYGLHDDILLMSESFVVYPDDEYLSVSCDAETACFTSNNDKITIYYKINNNSEIIIKDNDGNIINHYYNIIDEGEIVYTIPGDIEHLNTYPNWKIYLNNTDYPTSFNKDITVYWSLFIIPTPTPTFTPIPTPDINISDEIDNLKDEISPIKDLFIGLSSILVDNPDYNKDNIVDENEINHWFNSLIPMCIILLLIVLFLGLKQKRK